MVGPSLLAAALLVAAAAQADDVQDAAKKAFRQGTQLFEAGDYVAAGEAFRAA